jgi:predicted RNase H-like HicB family nuclease
MYPWDMLRYHVAFYLPKPHGRMVVAEALDFPGAVSQGFDLADARVMISSALEDLAQMLLEEGQPLPLPDPSACSADADLIELVPLSVEAGACRPGNDAC